MQSMCIYPVHVVATIYLCIALHSTILPSHLYSSWSFSLLYLPFYLNPFLSHTGPFTGQRRKKRGGRSGYFYRRKREPLLNRTTGRVERTRDKLIADKDKPPLRDRKKSMERARWRKIGGRKPLTSHLVVPPPGAKENVEYRRVG